MSYFLQCMVGPSQQSSFADIGEEFWEIDSAHPHYAELSEFLEDVRVGSNENKIIWLSDILSILENMEEFMANSVLGRFLMFVQHYQNDGDYFYYVANPY